MADAIQIVVGDVTDVEARILARYVGPQADGVEMQGTMRGPFCEGARTLPAEFQFRPVRAEPNADVIAQAVVTDPCLWSADMPHLYHVDVVARQGENVVSEYHGKVGLRRLAPRRPVDFAPGTG